MTTRRRLLAGLSCLAVVPQFVSAAPVAKSTAVVGAAAPEFVVIDSSKRVRTQSEFGGHPVVLEWTSPSCPFAKAQYDSGRMQELQKWAAGHGAVWLTVLSSHPSRSDYLEPSKADTFVHSRGGAATATLFDASGDVGHSYGAKTANHMFIIDKLGVLRYAGGIDDGQTMDAKKVLAAHGYVRSALETSWPASRFETPRPTLSAARSRMQGSWA